MSKKVRIIATVVVGLLWFGILALGGFDLDWPWNALWTDPSAIRWMEVVKIMVVQAIGSLAIIAIWKGTWKKP